MTKLTRVGVRLSDDERDILEALAKLEACSMSEIARTAIIDYAKRTNKP